MSLSHFFTHLKEILIADEPPHLDDERHYGLLASDIARKTGLHPGVIKKELDAMEAVNNPLLSPDLLRSGNRHGGFKELVDVVNKRVAIAYPDKPRPL